MIKEILRKELKKSIKSFLENWENNYKYSDPGIRFVVHKDKKQKNKEVVDLKKTFVLELTK